MTNSSPLICDCHLLTNYSHQSDDVSRMMLFDWTMAKKDLMQWLCVSCNIITYMICSQLQLDKFLQENVKCDFFVAIKPVSCQTRLGKEDTDAGKLQKQRGLIYFKTSHGAQWALTAMVHKQKELRTSRRVGWWGSRSACILHASTEAETYLMHLELSRKLRTPLHTAASGEFTS